MKARVAATSIIALVSLVAVAGPLAQTNTGRIAGVVMDAQPQPQPVNRAIVTLTGSDLPAGLATVTDDQGRFTFDRLPGGHFTLAATKPAYLKTAYGATRPGDAGTPITVAAGQQLTDVRMTLAHGGAIGGVIRDTKGDPIQGLQVSVVSLNAPAPRPISRADAATTDDRGAYRLFGLGPGTYLVSATTATSGGLGEVGIMSAAEVDAAFARLRQGPAASSSRQSSPSSIVRPTRSFTTSPVFFPGVAATNRATPITLGAGEERNDVDFAYQLSRSVIVSGTVTGGGTGVLLSLSADLPDSLPVGFGMGPMSQDRTGVAADGTFTFTSVTPGTYTLIARKGGSSAGMAQMTGVAPGGPPMYTELRLEVGDDDIRGLAMTLLPALHVTGRVAFEATSTPRPANFGGFRIQLMEASSAAPANINTAPKVYNSSILADGTFDVIGAMPGSYRLSLLPVPPAWLAKSAMLGDRDLFDVPLEVGTADISGVLVQLTDKHSQITGRLDRASGLPVNRYVVIAFPADRTLWQPRSRRLKSAPPATDGQYRFDDLPAGEYCVAAISDAAQDDWQTPEFLSRTIGSAVKVTLADGEKKTVDLRVGG